MQVHAISPGPGFLEACARHVLSAAARFLPDLSGVCFLLPNQHIAPATRRALGVLHGAPLWMPKLYTLTGVAAASLANIHKDSDCARQMRLFEVLRGQSLFKSQGLWQITSELAQLFDELTERGVSLPPTHEALAHRLAAGYDALPCESLSFEARFVHALWQADREGLPSLAAALQQALLEVVEAAPVEVPVFLMCDGALSATEHRFVEALAKKTEVHVFLPKRAGTEEALLATLFAAWPVAPEAPPIERARQLARAHPSSALADRVSFLSAASLHEEAANVALAVRQALERGAKSVALIASDRLAARRARSALSLQGIEAADETGWLLSTTRAAAFIDALLELLSSQAYHRAVLDLSRAPFCCADWAPAVR
ncbi:MAG: hypothetical protein RIR70_1738, partial [Pseudomonadota bacterium]